MAPATAPMKGQLSSLGLVVVALSLAVVSSSAAAGRPFQGPFQVNHKKLGCSNLDSTDPNIEVWYPSDSAGGSFPLISYAHGYTGGGSSLFGSYNTLLSELASFGFIVAATRSCSYGCKDDTTSLPQDPAGFGHYYYEQYKTIDCAASYFSSGTAPFDAVDFDAGVGISGHSMGGQATLFSSAQGFGDRDYSPSAKNVVAAVMHNAYNPLFNSPAGSKAAVPTIPFLATTGSKDTTAAPRDSQNFYNAAGDKLTRGYVEQSAGTHNGVLSGQAAVDLARYTAAFFKIFIAGESSSGGGGFDYEELIFGNSSVSACGGGFGVMTACETFDGR